jgi:DNA-binding CsgD family transcriptional regulator/tetratricopeptide (TPR) repeat protein
MPSGQAVGGPPFVGRRTELDALTSVVGRLADGGGGIALVTGGAGIGKSRLVATALDLMTPTGATTTGVPGGTRTGFGECLPDLLMPPLWPVSRAVASAAHSERGGAQDWTDLVALLRPSAGAADRAGGASFSPGWDRLAVLGDIVDHLVTASRSAPVVLVLEDVHWADPETLALLRLLTPELARCPLVVLATARPATDDDHAAALAGLTASPSTQVVALGPLSVADVEQYLEDGSYRADATEVQALSGGLPLLLPVAIGATHDGHQESAAAALSDRARLRVDVPTLVRRLTVSLTDEHVAVLEGASLVTTGLDAEVAAAAAGVPVASAGDATAAAVRAGVLTAAAKGGGLTFVHDLVRESLSSRLSPERSRAAHRRLAVLLAARTGIPAVRVAAHWDAAGADPDACAEAATWWQRASGESARLRAYEDAAALQAKAVLAAEAAGTSATELAEISLGAARAWYRAGRYDEAVAEAQRASTAANRADRVDLMAEAALAVPWVVYPGAQTVLGGLGRTALERGGPRLGTALRARLLAHQVAMLGHEAESQGASTAVEALSVARRSRDPQALLDAIGARMDTLPEAGSASEQYDLADEAILLSTRLEQPLSEVVARTWRLKAVIELGRTDLVAGELDRLDAIGAATRLPLAEWHALRARVAVAILRGTFVDIPDLHDRATSIADASGDVVAAGIGHAALLELASRRGVPWPDSLLEVFAAAPASPLVEAPKALLLHQGGRLDEARTIYERLLPLMGAGTTVRPWGPVLYQILDLAERFGDTAVGVRLVDALAPRVEGVDGGVGTSTVWFIGNPRFQLGRALALAGRDEEALAALGESIRLNERIGARPDVALARIETARLLGRLNGDRDARAARTRSGLAQAKRAVEECRGLDMPGHAARAAALVTGLTARVAADDPLSPREREVVDLVVQGLTNQQIAGRLFLSERTVESHVRAALMKLGCRNRAELIRLETGGGFSGGPWGRSPRGLA